MSGLAPGEVAAAIRSAAAMLPVDQRETFEDRAGAWLAQYSCPTHATVQEVLTVVKRDLCLAAPPPEHRP